MPPSAWMLRDRIGRFCHPAMLRRGTLDAEDDNVLYSTFEGARPNSRGAPSGISILSKDVRPNLDADCMAVGRRCTSPGAASQPAAPVPSPPYGSGHCLARALAFVLNYFSYQVCIGLPIKHWLSTSARFGQ